MPAPNTEDTRTTGIDVEPTVEDCLRELREMLPDQQWITCRAMARYSGYSEIGRYAEIEIDSDSYRAATLNECMAQVRSWKQEQEKSNA